jgi:hypothetical protein
MRALLFGLLGAALLALATKFFTFEAVLKDDPTVYLVLRPAPSLENRLFLEDSSQLAGAWVLAEDENALWGEGLYEWVVRIGWWLLPVLALAGWGMVLARRGAS